MDLRLQKPCSTHNAMALETQFGHNRTWNKLRASSSNHLANRFLLSTSRNFSGAIFSNFCVSEWPKNIQITSADKPRQPTGGRRTSQRSPTCGYRGGHDIFCGGQGWTTGGHHKMVYYWKNHRNKI